MSTLYATALQELGRVFDGIDDARVDDACQMIAGAGRVMVYGCGREGLQIRGFAMRLHHLGCDVSVVGDMSAPPLGEGDVFVVTAGPGYLSTASALCAIAKKAGARILFLTAQPGGDSARFGDLMLVIPAQTMANDRGAAATSVLPMGSVYEGALFVLFEVMVLKLRALLGATPLAMRARHTNME